MNTTTIRQWGNSYAVRLPKAVMLKMGLQAGNLVEVREAGRKGIISVIPVRNPSASLSEMVSRITKKNVHGTVDWGVARGLEIW